MKQAVQCKVEGMTCGNCAMSIQKYLESEGASDVVANAATGTVSFVGSEEVELDILYQGIQKLGFKVIPPDQKTSSSSSATLKKYLIFAVLLWLPLMAHMFVSWPILHQAWFQCALSTPVLMLGFWHFGRSAWRSLKNGIPNMDVLVIIGASAAYFYSMAGWYMHPLNVHQYLFFETCSSIITLVLAGNFLEAYTVQSTSTAIQELMKYRKTKARILFTDSIGKESIQETDNDAVRLNDILIVNSGDMVAADGVMISGEASINEAMMSGESLPVLKKTGDTVIGGTIVMDGQFRMSVTAIGDSTAIAQIIELVNRAQAAKPPLQKLADRISAIFVPVVLGISMLTLFVSVWILDIEFQEGMMRSIAVLVIACPCAMGLATPAAVMVGLGRAARRGILVKGGDTLEKLVKVKQFVFDKTGTLTTGELEIDQFESTLPETQFRQVICSLESHSSHPIAKSILRQWTAEEKIDWKAVEEIKGIGLRASALDGSIWILGSYRILDKQPVDVKHDLWLTKNGVIMGWMDLKDSLRPDAKAVIAQLQKQGMKCILLSGDRQEKCDQIGKELGMDEVYGEQLPAQKLQKLEALEKNGPTLMVGDGINDAPALTKASVGVSLSDASQIAIQSAGIILLQNKLSLLLESIALGKHTYQTIRQNLFWAFAYNVVAIPVAFMGLLTPSWGAAIMGLSDVILISNSLKLRFKKI
ncbi:MAG: cadmium-translocating P-type ATPase [Bacteroidetes bacterium]|nr:cadmium-translocating P-type ATPase [Bacteroidota bacterium]